MIPETSNIFIYLEQGVKKAIDVLSVPRYFSHFKKLISKDIIYRNSNKKKSRTKFWFKRYEPSKLSKGNTPSVPK